MKTILSFGGGVNSMAILCQGIKGKVEFDDVVMADPGSEMPKTYEYVSNVVENLCENNGISFHIVGDPTLYTYCWDRNIFPYRLFRWCTDKYKIRPIRKWTREKYGKDYIMLLGIDAGEKRRSTPRDGIRFPLVDLGINRTGCKKVIDKFRLPIPPKSGCYFCPYQKISQWKWLYENHKDLYLKAEALEKNCSAYPKHTLAKVRLDQLRKSIETQTKLFSGTPDNIERCLFCHS